MCAKIADVDTFLQVISFFSETPVSRSNEKHRFRRLSLQKYTQVGQAVFQPHPSFIAKTHAPLQIPSTYSQMMIRMGYIHEQ